MRGIFRPWMLVCACLVLLGSLVWGARQLILSLSEPVTEHVPVASVTTTGAAGSTTSPLAATEPRGGEREAAITFGEPTIIPPSDAPATDTIEVNPGTVVEFDDPPAVTTTVTAPVAGDGDDSGSGDEGASGTGALPRPDVVDPERAPTPQPFGVGIWTEPDSSHLTKLVVGVNKGPNELSRVVVDFGDNDTLELDGLRLNQLEDGGTMEIVHRYEPTLTPQPQTASVTAVDSTGEVEDWSVDFTTQAEFVLSYSPLTVTAHGDCDLFGKGDFELRWNNDGRDRTSRFDLGAGEAYVEEEFSVGLDRLRYLDNVPFEMEFVENDSLPVSLLEIAVFDYSALSSGYDLYLEVLQFGTHTIPISIEDEGDCPVSLAYEVTLAISERTAG